MEKEKKAVVVPTIKENGLVDVKFKSGETHEMHPDLADKMVAAKAADYV